MAKFDIHHNCGHVVTHEICGKMDQRAGRADWLESQPCRDCRRTADIAAAAEVTSELPLLIGTDKQVAWATQIRADAYQAVKAVIRADLGEKQRAVLEWLWSRPAGWWIDRRDHGKNARAWLLEAQHAA